MNEPVSGMSPKSTFLMGILGGIALVSSIGFFILLPKVLSNSGGGGSSEGNTKGAALAPTPLPDDGDDTAPQAAASLPEVSKEDYVRGDANAPITIIEYSDFECPFCLRHLPTVNRILSEYKGKVRLVYRHFPLSFHPQAQKAAEAYECAGEQGGADKAYSMHDKIFEANEQQIMSVEQWKKYATELKLNTSKFNDCVDTGKYANKVRQQMAGGSSAGVSGTPATFVNGRIVSGAVPYETFKSLIDSLL